MESKTYFLDTSVILDSSENILTLSDNGQNVIVICDIVLNELDAKKSGVELINYNARDFNRFSEKSIVISVEKHETFKRVITKNGNCEIHLVSLIESSFNRSNLDLKILNDRKIIETAEKLSHLYPNPVILSNDIAFRISALLEGLNVESFKSNEVETSDIDFMESISLEEDIKFPISARMLTDKLLINSKTSGVELINSVTGNRTYVYRNGNIFEEIDEKFLEKQNCKPINMRQKVSNSIMQSESNDIFVLVGAAGSGKNVMALSAACALIDAKNSNYSQIIYIRKTVTSVDNKQEELGFLPGDLDAKMGGYIKPLMSSIRTLVKRKFPKVKAKEEIETAITEFMSKYNIGFEYEGFLRGDTFPENSIILLDEFQNDSQSSIKLTLTRVGKDSKVFILGDVNQIDNVYVNSKNNALSYMLTECGKENEDDVRVQGMILTETVRSKIASYADKF